MELFLDRVKRCNKCDRIEWISRQYCPCGKKYAKDNEERTRQQQAIMQMLEEMDNGSRHSLYLETSKCKETKEKPYGRKFW